MCTFRRRIFSSSYSLALNKKVEYTSICGYIYHRYTSTHCQIRPAPPSLFLSLLQKTCPAQRNTIPTPRNSCPVLAGRNTSAALVNGRSWQVCIWPATPGFILASGTVNVLFQGARPAALAKTISNNSQSSSTSDALYLTSPLQLSHPHVGSRNWETRIQPSWTWSPMTLYQ